MATISVTYDSTLSRLRIAVTGLVGTAVTAKFERAIQDVGIWSTVRGGSSVNVSGAAASLDDYEWPSDPGSDLNYRVTAYDVSGVQVDQVTEFDAVAPALDSIWAKIPAAPYLNMPITVVDRSAIERKSRAGLFPIVGRSKPVMVGDVAGSLQFELQLLTENAADERNLDYLFASGEVLFLHLPAGVEHFPGGYYAVGDVTRETTLRLSARRVWTVPLTEVAPPGPDVIGSAYTWASAVAEYATWADLIADNLTWADLLQRTGTPSDVIVP